VNKPTANEPLIIAGLLGVVAVAVLVYVFVVGPGKPGIEEITVDKMLKAPRAGSEVRVRGYVKPGTIRRSPELTTFVIATSGQPCPVRHHGPVPDGLKDDADVVLVGKLIDDDHNWIVDSHEIIAH
jgi:cytochrome c-type biogenesis protein CcmE